MEKYNTKMGNAYKVGKPKCKICGVILSNYNNIVCKKHRYNSKETKLKMSHSHIGLNTWTKGKKKSEDTRKKMSISRSGEKNCNWIVDRTKLKKSGDAEKDRRSSTYNSWRKEVWKRDNWKCKILNGDCKGRIESHHILSYTDYPELRYNINNGITLCHFHHPRMREEEKRMIPIFQELLSVSKVIV